MLNCTPFVRRYDIPNNKSGVFYAKRSSKEEVHKRIKQQVIAAMQIKHLSHRETTN